MSGRVLVIYCMALIACLYSVGLAISSPLAENYFSITIDVGQDEAFSY